MIGMLQFLIISPTAAVLPFFARLICAILNARYTGFPYMYAILLLHDRVIL